MKEIFDSPREIFDGLKNIEYLIVNLRIKVMGCPYSNKFTRPKFEIKDKFLYLKSENTNKEEIIIPLYLIEEVRVRWEMFGVRNGQRMTVNCNYFKNLLPKSMWSDISKFCGVLLPMQDTPDSEDDKNL